MKTTSMKNSFERETFFKPLTQRTVYYCVVPGRYAKFVAMAKLEPFTSDNPNPMTEPGDVWFELGETRAEAYWKITNEMIKLGLEKDVIFCGGGEEGKL